MSMIGNLIRVSESEIKEYQQNSHLLEEKVYDPAEAQNPNHTDIDKAWDGIIFLLTGGGIAESYEHPLSRILFSGQIIDEEQDMGYGPAHYLLPDQVKELNTKLAAISEQDFKKKYDPEKMTQAEVYPNIWEKGVDEVEYLWENFEQLRQTFHTASLNNEGIITFIS